MGTTELKDLTHDGDELIETKTQKQNSSGDSHCYSAMHVTQVENDPEIESRPL
jgi:hypothetical protein